MANVYSTEEVARHNRENDLWMVIHGSVYDLTKFLKEHPGGEEVLVNLAGQDGSTCFDEIGHSGEAIQLRETLKIGTLHSESVKGRASELPVHRSDSRATPDTNDQRQDDEDWQYEEAKEEPSSWLSFFLALGVAVYSVIIYYFWL